ncbi:MAG: hypothetical protein A3C84_01245 [Candidatus Ryanbacteria bacterium RIFCSPHIGHO2_02_FULL_48_12]|nr:MAG: hypothetical protein A3C84_01245 [Candidatus Ryanbacteria bacterium RIFCSPHIGHO2_02_FULL_48_12]
MPQAILLKPTERRWVNRFFLVMEFLHKVAFGEKDVFKRIFLAEGDADIAAQYITPEDAGRFYPGRVPDGEDMFLLLPQSFLSALNLIGGTAAVLGINKHRPLPKYLMVITKAIHECRHKAHARGAPILKRPAMEECMMSMIPPSDASMLASFLVDWFALNGIIRGTPATWDEWDAVLIEGSIVFLWDRYLRRLRTAFDPERVLLEFYAPRIIKLGMA